MRLQGSATPIDVVSQPLAHDRLGIRLSTSLKTAMAETTTNVQ